MVCFYSIDKYIAKTIATVDKTRRITTCQKQVFLLLGDKGAVLSTPSTGNFVSNFCLLCVIRLQRLYCSLCSKASGSSCWRMFNVIAWSIIKSWSELIEPPDASWAIWFLTQRRCFSSPYVCFQLSTTPVPSEKWFSISKMYWLTPPETEYISEHILSRRLYSSKNVLSVGVICSFPFLCKSVLRPKL